MENKLKVSVRTAFFRDSLTARHTYGGLPLHLLPPLGRSLSF